MKITDDHFCFACGQDNPDGLRLRMEYPGPGRCRAEFVPGRKFQGWLGILHGGIISTLLDEGFAHAYGGVERGRGAAAVTAEMTVRFKKPAKTGQKCVLEGRVVGRDRKIITCKSVLKDEDGVEIASATGKLILVKDPTS
ncbi:MAG: PaaI family thioesterase [Candidatus Aminicenantes bacterium]|nr:PaaI family thioesterase [Candidatus Aminicenantes bacterium]